MHHAIASVGKGRDKLLAALAARYQERLSRTASVTLTHVPQVEGEGRSPEEVRRLEARRLLEALARWDRAASRAVPLAALDERGEMLTSRQLATWIEGLAATGTPRLHFVIGGDEGLHDSVRERADRVLALSRLTLTHEMAKALLLEQLYRVETIRKGHPYHRD